MKQLAACVQLRDLGLCGTRVTDEGAKHLRGMKEMRWLSLGETAVGDDALQVLAGLKHLRELDLPVKRPQRMRALLQACRESGELVPGDRRGGEPALGLGAFPLAFPRLVG